MRTNKDTRGRSYFNVFPEQDGQTDVSFNYPGTIRAFHLHKVKTEWFAVMSGDFKIVLTDPDEVVYMREGDVLQIDPGRWHGFQVLGNEVGIMIENSNYKHDVENPDDFREDWDKFDNWEIERK